MDLLASLTLSNWAEKQRKQILQLCVFTMKFGKYHMYLTDFQINFYPTLRMDVITRPYIHTQILIPSFSLHLYFPVN